MIKKLSILFYAFLILCIIPTQIFSEKLLYNVYQNNQEIYTILYEIKKTRYYNQDAVELSTTLSGPKIQEYNVCILSQDYKTLYVFQESENELENLYYTWEIQNTEKLANGLHYDKKNNLLKQKEFEFPNQGYTLQAIIYLFQNKDFLIDQSFTFHLLVPDFIFHNINAHIQAIESLTIHNQPISCYRIELSLAGFFGFFLPKMNIWLTHAPPHIPIKYQEWNKTVILTKQSLEKL